MTQRFEDILINSDWWNEATLMPDRHFDASTKIMLSDHLESVKNNCLTLLEDDPKSEYIMDVQIAIESVGLSRQVIQDVLVPIALLHDIGKAREDKTKEVYHPLSGKAKIARHPLMSLIAAIELLPENTAHRESIQSLIEEHDTPYSWHIQYQKSGQKPSAKAWKKLDRKSWNQNDGTGIFLLSLFKLADIDGHEDVSDVWWFIEQANRNCLEINKKLLPVPTESDIQEIARIAKVSTK